MVPGGGDEASVGVQRVHAGGVENHGVHDDKLAERVRGDGAAGVGGASVVELTVVSQQGQGGAGGHGVAGDGVTTGGLESARNGRGKFLGEVGFPHRLVAQGAVLTIPIRVVGGRSTEGVDHVDVLITEELAGPGGRVGPLVAIAAVHAGEEVEDGSPPHIRRGHHLVGNGALHGGAVHLDFHELVSDPALAHKLSRGSCLCRSGVKPETYREGGGRCDQCLSEMSTHTLLFPISVSYTHLTLPTTPYV